jgi:hypothetical protein
MIGHPERSLPRFTRQTESKDLHLFFNELQTPHWVARFPVFRYFPGAAAGASSSSPESSTSTAEPGTKS